MLKCFFPFSGYVFLFFFFLFNIGKGGHSNIVFVFVSPNATSAKFCQFFFGGGAYTPVIFYCTLRQCLKEEPENPFSGGFFFP